MPTEIMFVVGEPSGDLHTAQLATALQERGEFLLTGAGGPAMRAAGVKTDLDSTSWGAIGVAQGLCKVPALYRRKLQLLRLLQQRRPALLVYVDFGAFNVRLARTVRRLSFYQPALYYFPPASWDRRVRDRSELAQLVDAVATPFPWSADLLRRDGVNAHFVGNPVLDRLSPVSDKVALRAELGLPSAAHYVGLMPGSRPIERRLLGPEMLRAAIELTQEGNYHFLWSHWPGSSDPREGLEARVAQHLTIMSRSTDLLQAADLVLTSFGTSTLEAAAVECPMLTMYRGTWGMRLQYRLMHIPTEYYAMPNIILQRRLVPELIQDEATGPRLAALTKEILDDPEALAMMRAGLHEARSTLGKPGAAGRTADLAMEIITRVAEGSH